MFKIKKAKNKIIIGIIFVFSLIFGGYQVYAAVYSCCYHECNLTDPRKCENNKVMECQSNCDDDRYQDWCEIQDCSATSQTCQVESNAAVCSGTCNVSCTTAPGCRASLANGHTTAASCCGSGYCYTCDNGYTWNNNTNACVANCIPACTSNASCNDGNSCTDDVCNNAYTCTAACAHNAITACVNNDNCCPTTCTSVNDNNCVATIDTTDPTVNTFTATVSGSNVNIDYVVTDTDGSHIDRVEIWRAPDVSGVPGAWLEVTTLRQTITSSNLDSYTHTVTDTPGNGTWWYGVHVVDQRGNWGKESSPIQHTITSAPVCVDDGCNSNCPTNCTVTDDPDCGCQNGNSCCGISCTNVNDSDCTCTSTCATGPGCRTSLANATVTAGACCSGSCYACNSGYTWNDPICTLTSSCAYDGCNGNCPANCTSIQDFDCSLSGCCGDNVCIAPETSSNCSGDCTSSSLEFSIVLPTKFQYEQGDMISFNINAMGGSFPYTYRVISDLQGELYQGGNSFFNIDTSNLTVSTHVFSLIIRDNIGIETIKKITIEIIGVGNLVSPIYSPSNNQQFSQGATVNFSSFASGGTAPHTYQWNSDKDGLIGNQDYFSVNNLSVGKHRITLTAKDSNGNSISSYIDIEIILGLVININNPKNYSSYEQGSGVIFSASATGGTYPQKFVWTSDRDGAVGTVTIPSSTFFSTFFNSSLSLGKHVITVTVTDNLGATASKNIAIEIVMPTCIDNDNDGYGVVTSKACKYYNILDCNDNDSGINPTAVENCANNIDEDCNGSTTDCNTAPEIIMPAVDSTFIWGSSSTIQARISGVITAPTVYIRDADEKALTSVTLYNDGSHNDGAAGDDIYAGLWNALGSAGNYHVDLTYYFNGTNKKSYENLRNLEIVNAPTCDAMINNGGSSDKLDITFVADRYNSTNINNFETAATAAMNRLLTISPFNVNNSKINFYRINSFLNSTCQNVSATKLPVGQYDIPCSSMASLIGSLCPSDEVVVLANSNFRSFAYFGGYAVVSALGYDPSGTTVHELGHSFASLADEYYPEAAQSAATSSVESSINCDTTLGCPKWSGVTGTGCHAGCYYRTYFYRSVNNGIMRTSSNNNDFGVLNINHIKSLLEKYK